MSEMHTILLDRGIEDTDDVRRQLLVMIEALRIYSEREEKYAGAWKEYGALNNLVRLSTKVKRLTNRYWKHHVEADPDPDLDDAYDAINYAVFFIRQAKEGQWTHG